MGKSDQPPAGENRSPVSLGQFPPVPPFDRAEDRDRPPPVSDDNPLTLSDQGKIACQAVFQFSDPDGVHVAIIATCYRLSTLPRR